MSNLDTILSIWDDFNSIASDPLNIRASLAVASNSSTALTADSKSLPETTGPWLARRTADLLPARP